MSELRKKTQHDDCMRRFIDLANELKNGGVPVNVVSWALMSASGIYATYSVVGNDGGLNESGVDKVAGAYRKNLANIQELKRAQGMLKEDPMPEAGAEPAENAENVGDAADGGEEPTTH